MKLIGLLSIALSLANSYRSGQETAANRARIKEAMRHVRMMDLTSPASKWGFKKDKAFPRVFGVLVDCPLGQGETATTIALRDGTASLYTTTSFGVIGAGEHKGPHDAAIKLVEFAQKRWDAAKPTKDFAYPKAGQVRMFLVGYNGVRVFQAKQSDLEAKKGEAELFFKSDEVVKEIRIVSGG